MHSPFFLFEVNIFSKFLTALRGYYTSDKGKYGKLELADADKMEILGEEKSACRIWQTHNFYYFFIARRVIKYAWYVCLKKKIISFAAFF